jgi:hypothetical protein
MQVLTALFGGAGSYSPVWWCRFLQPCLVVQVRTALFGGAAAVFVGAGSYILLL